MSRKQQALAALAAGAIGATALGLAPTLAAAAPEDAAEAAIQTGVRITEVESSGGTPGDWIELFNGSDAPADLSGFAVRDAEDDHVHVLPEGTVVAPGAYLVLDELSGGAGDFDFGLGKADSVRLFDPSGALVDSVSWTEHAVTTLGLHPDGGWLPTAEPTKGAANVFAESGTPGDGVRLNEIDSSPADWVELVNTGETAVDLAGFELRDNSDDHRWQFPAGASIAAGAMLVVDERSAGVANGVAGTFGEAIGIGSADRIRLFDPAGAQIDDSGAWEGHAEIDGDAALATLARCPDGVGDFGLAKPTPAAANVCVDDDGGDGETPTIETQPWAGPAETRVLDASAMFLEDSSGLDAQQTADGVVLWAVDNGEGRFWKLRAQSDGSVAFADGWEQGKRARFAKDAENPAAKGPDTEGITVAGDGLIYLASERDNSAKGVNFNSVLQIDPEAPGPDVVASREWDLTAQLPQVSANLGIEAVEWVADADLAGSLRDERTGTAYDPADYPLHGDGLFFVAVEDGGQVFAFALNSDGTAQRIAQLDPGMPAVMALDYDRTLGGLWAVCDDGCHGTAAFLELGPLDDGEAAAAADGAAALSPATVTHYARPAGLPDTNNEGFATAPGSLVADGTRPAWWFTDGVRPAALRAGALFADTEQPGGTPEGAADGAEGAADGAADGAGAAADADGGAGASNGSSAAGDASGAARGAGSGSNAGAATGAPGAEPLARTGGDDDPMVLFVVSVLVVAGAAMMVFSRRRRAD